MLEMAKDSSFIILTLENNDQINLKVNFTRYCFRELRNIVELHLAII